LYYFHSTPTIPPVRCSSMCYNTNGNLNGIRQ
jgi:hypothetical protein